MAETAAEMMTRSDKRDVLAWSVIGGLRGYLNHRGKIPDASLVDLIAEFLETIEAELARLEAPRDNAA